MKAKHQILILIAVLLAFLLLQPSAYAVQKVFYKQALTGNTVTSLDGINGSHLANNDLCFVTLADAVYAYRLNSTSGAAESSPDIISPDTNAGNKRWILQSYYGAGSGSVSDTAYNASSWDNVTDAAPSKNAVRDKIEALHATGGDTALGVLGTKNPPIDADKAIYRDSTTADALVTSTWTQIKAFLKTYFDSLYQADMGITAKSDSTSTTSSTSVASSTAVKSAYDLAALKLNTADPAYTGKITGAAPTELTLATDAITVTQTFHTVDTQADAASDDLATISGFSDTQIIFLRASHTDRSVVLVETGNILIPYGTQITLDDTSRWVMLVYDANLTKWVVVGTLPDTLNVGGISLGGIVLGDSTPDAAGELGYAGTLTYYDAVGLKTVKTTSEVEKIASFAWDGGGSAVATASSKRCTVIPFGVTVTGVYAIADASTTTHLHVYQDAFATGARSTTVTGAVDIGATLGSLDNTLTSWDTSITAGDEICMSVESNNNAKWLNVIVYGHR